MWQTVKPPRKLIFGALPNGGLRRLVKQHHFLFTCLFKRVAHPLSLSQIFTIEMTILNYRKFSMNSFDSPIRSTSLSKFSLQLLSTNSCTNRRSPCASLFFQDQQKRRIKASRFRVSSCVRHSCKMLFG